MTKKQLGIAEKLATSLSIKEKRKAIKFLSSLEAVVILSIFRKACEENADIATKNLMKFAEFEETEPIFKKLQIAQREKEEIINAEKERSDRIWEKLKDKS